MTRISFIVFLLISMIACTSPSGRQKGRLGYMRSNLYCDSLSLFEQGILVITPDRKQTGFIVFSKDSSQIEFFLSENVRRFVRISDSLWSDTDKQEIVFENRIWTVKEQSKVLYLQPMTECEPALGTLKVMTYVSARNILSVKHQAYSGDGIFQLIRIRQDVPDTTGSVSMDWGIRYTLRGVAGNKDATVWQCRTNAGEIFNFLFADDKHIMLLDSKERGIDTLTICQYD